MDINKTTAPKETIYAPFKPDEEAPYIFISYSHRDRDRVFPIITRLYEKGWRVWYDEGLEVTENYYTSLSRHIKGCTVFLLFLTENSVKSEFVSEHELLLATTMRKRIAVCRLDENAEFEGEAKDAIDIATVSKKNPKTDEAGLEAALEGIEELPRFAPRKAEGFKVRLVNYDILESASEEDEYEFEKCEGGVRLSNYKGRQQHVEIPGVYKGQPVVKLDHTFHRNSEIISVRIPPTVKRIESFTFYECERLTDLFSPSSVSEIDDYALNNDSNYKPYVTSIHCAEDSEAYRYAKEDPKHFQVVVDPSMNVTEAVVPVARASEHEAFCGFASDCRVEAERIIGQLTDSGCSVVSSVTLKGMEKSKRYREAACMIVFLSQGYIDEGEIDYLYRAIEGNKPFIIYALDNCVLPDDIDIAKIHDQQLRFDNGTEPDRIAKLLDWLRQYGCVSASADIPDYEYTTDTDGGIILIRYTGSASDVIVPAGFGGHPVVALKETFWDDDHVTAITVPNGVKRVGEWAFNNCSQLVSVTLPDSVTEIEEFAFTDCVKLASIDLPDHLEAIGNAAFEDCYSLTSVTIPDSVRSIGRSAFLDCKNLVSVTLPKGLATIEEYLFAGCESLASLTIPDSVTQIGESAFVECGCLDSLAFSERVESIGKRACADCGSLTSVTIRGKKTTLGKNVFEDSDKVTVYCHRHSAAWDYCEENNIPHKKLGGLFSR